MQQLIPPNLFVPFRSFTISENMPSDHEVINSIFEEFLYDTVQNEEDIDEMMKLDIEKKWQFVLSQSEQYAQEPSPECFIKYISMDNFKNFNMDSLKVLHDLLQKGSIRWTEAFVLKHKGHHILINKIIQNDNNDYFKNLHHKEVDLELFKYIFKCIGFIENITSCQQALLDEKKLLPTLLNALSIQNDEIFAIVLQDLIPYLLNLENKEVFKKYFQNSQLYSNISNILKKEPTLFVIKCLVSFLNASISYFDKIGATVNFILHLQKESIITQLQTIKVPETEKVYRGLQFFLKKVDAILVPLNQIFTPSIKINPFKHKDVYDYASNQIGKKNIMNMNLSLIELKCHHSRQFDKAYTFLQNFLTLYRQFISKGINISINDVASQAVQMNQLYDPGTNAEFTDDFYAKLYEESSFVPSVILKYTKSAELNKNDDDPFINEYREENEILIQQIASLCMERESIINKDRDLKPLTEELEALKLENAQMREESAKLNVQINALRSLSTKAIQERDELQKIIDKSTKEATKQDDRPEHENDDTVIKKEDYIKLEQMVKFLSSQLDEKNKQYNQVVAYFNQKLEAKNRALDEIKRNVKQANNVFANLTT